MATIKETLDLLKRLQAGLEQKLDHVRFEIEEEDRDLVYSYERATESQAAQSKEKQQALGNIVSRGESDLLHLRQLQRVLEKLDRFHYMKDKCLEDALMPFTVNDLLNRVEREAQSFHGDALNTVIRSRTMNDLTDQDVLRFSRTPKSTQRLIDAILVAFINHISHGSGGDRGTRTRDIF